MTEPDEKPRIPTVVEVEAREDAQSPISPKVMERASLIRRLRYFIKIWTLKSRTWFIFAVLRLVNFRALRLSLPDCTKRYPARPMLTNRVFVPKDHVPGVRHPLWMTIHGGGFTVGDPQGDDPLNRILADKHGFVIVAINYCKAPQYPFPVPVHDTAEIIREVLNDPDLPVDYSRVALGGWSAGGTLCLAAAQLPGIKERVQSLVAMYPAVDFTGRWTGPFTVGSDGKEDFLKRHVSALHWAYISPGTNLVDRLLSPIMATRDELPQRLFMIAAEHDYLCHENGVMARRLVGVGEEDKGFGDDWEAKGVRWKRVRGFEHGFALQPSTGEKERERLKLCEELFADIGAWLKR